MTYAAPFTLSLPLTPLDGGALLPYDCHEGNYAIRQSLGAERAEDAALAADLSEGHQARPRRPVQDGLGVGGQPIGEAGPGGIDSARGGRAGRETEVNSQESQLPAPEAFELSSFGLGVWKSEIGN